MTHFLTHLWQTVLEKGREHGVDPRVFAVLYLAHHPLFWGTLAWIAARLKAKKPVRALAALDVFFWFMPYLYVAVCGRGFPWWVYGIGLIVVAVGGRHAVQTIRRRLADPTEPPTEKETVNARR